MIHPFAEVPWPETHKMFRFNDKVSKVKGSHWRGRIVGWYSTSLTPEGYAVESSLEFGSVQIYPASALERNDKMPLIEATLVELTTG